MDVDLPRSLLGSIRRDVLRVPADPYVDEVFTGSVLCRIYSIGVAVQDFHPRQGHSGNPTQDIGEAGPDLVLPPHRYPALIYVRGDREMTDLHEMAEQMKKTLYPNMKPGCCVECNQTFEYEVNIFTQAGWREARITQTCEKCFDALWAECEEPPAQS